MTGFFTQLFTPVTGEDAFVKVLGALTILVLGHLGVKLLDYVFKSIWINRRDELTRKDVEKRNETLQYFSYLLDAGLIILALLYLNTGLTTSATQEFVAFLPEFVSAMLIAVLGIIAINLSVKVGGELLRVIGVESYFREVGLSENALNVITGLVKGFLYLILLQIALTQMGIGNTFIDELVTASSWALAFLIAGLVFYGFKDLLRNFAAGIYLKNSRMVRPGEEVKLEEENGEIRDVSLFSTTLDTDSGYTLMTPNVDIMESNIRFKRTKTDIDTLEDIKKHFVAQHPSYCGPAAMEMALEIFGYRHDQDTIGEKSGTTREEGTDREELMEAVEELTDQEVKTAFIEYDKINDIGDEFKAWFDEGALIVPNFYKPAIFPEATTGHYVLSVAVEGNEILVVDPSKHTGTGGVYYIDADRLYDAMGDFDHKRGYIVAAPEGSTAHWRIKNGLVYSDKSYYDELSKTLEARLRKLLRQGGLLKNVMPSPIEKYLEDWRSGQRVTNLWKPGEEDEDTENN